MKEEVINQELDKDQWKLEAQAIINDVKQHVMDIKVSEKLQNIFNPNLAEDIRVTVIYKDSIVFSI